MAVKKEKLHAHPASLKLYEKLVGTIPEIEVKGDTMKYTSLNGNMYSFLSKEGEVAMRLPEPDRQEFLKNHKTKLFEAYGAVMKEYVAVPENLLANTKLLKKYFATSYEYVKSLKPKPTTKKTKN